MGQDLIFDFLRLQMMTGDERFWSVSDVQRELKKKNFEGVSVNSASVGRQLRKLYAHGYLDIAYFNGNIMRVKYRLNRKYLKLKDPSQVNVWFQQ